MRKRSKYRPKPVLANPLGYVIESMTPVAKHDSYLVDLKIKNSEAMYALLHGTAHRGYPGRLQRGIGHQQIVEAKPGQIQRFRAHFRGQRGGLRGALEIRQRLSGLL